MALYDDHTGANAGTRTSTPLFTSKEKFHFNMINKFYFSLDVSKINKMIEIIEGKSKVSLRLLDWFVTNYSKQYGIGYDIVSNGKEEYFDVNIGYKAELKSYKKVYFDPFRRSKRFKYKYDQNDPNKSIETALCQLNFFRWAFEYGVIEYVEENIEAINTSMVESKKKSKKSKGKSKDTGAGAGVGTGATTSYGDYGDSDDVSFVISFD